MNNDGKSGDRNSRRDFLKSSAALVSATGLGALAGTPGYVAGSDIIRVGLIGCGGRGTAAAVNAMNADKGVRIVAMADIRLDRIQESRSEIKVKKPDQVDVKDDHMFTGFDAYTKVIEVSDVVVIANAAKFHPLHMTAAIEAGKHVFVDKPHAIDPAGVKVVQTACEKAKQKGLSVVSGLQSRYDPGYRETVRRIHDGAIGKIIAVEENFLRGPYVLRERKPGQSEMEHQASNQYHFHWLSGDDVPQSLIHNLDRVDWTLRGEEPLKCRGLGGRSTLHGEIYGDVFDHHAVVYEFPSGVHVYAYCRTIQNCYNGRTSLYLGTKGHADIMKTQIEGETNWKYEGPKADPYDLEHVALFTAIRSGKPLNNGDYMVRSTRLALMGQISCYSGQEVTPEQFMASNFYYPPKPEECRADMEPPVKPGKDGVYPVAFTPGVSKLL